MKCELSLRYCSVCRSAVGLQTKKQDLPTPPGVPPPPKKEMWEILLHYQSEPH